MTDAMTTETTQVRSFCRFCSALCGIVVTLDSPTLGLLRREAQIAQQTPDLCLPELDTVQPLDENAHPLERPQVGTESVLGRALEQDAAQGL